MIELVKIINLMNFQRGVNMDCLDLTEDTIGSYKKDENFFKALRRGHKEIADERMERIIRYSQHFISDFNINFF